MIKRKSISAEASAVDVSNQHARTRMLLVKSSVLYAIVSFLALSVMQSICAGRGRTDRPFANAFAAAPTAEGVYGVTIDFTGEIKTTSAERFFATVAKPSAILVTCAT